MFASTDLGDFAIDREQVLGLPTVPLHLIAIYEVQGGLIRSLRFIRQFQEESRTMSVRTGS